MLSQESQNAQDFKSSQFLVRFLSSFSISSLSNQFKMHITFSYYINLLRYCKLHGLHFYISKCPCLTLQTVQLNILKIYCNFMPTAQLQIFVSPSALLSSFNSSRHHCPSVSLSLLLAHVFTPRPCFLTV